MSNTSSEILPSLTERNSFPSVPPKHEHNAEEEERSQMKPMKLAQNTFENLKSTSHSLSDDRSEHYARLLRESQQSVSNRDVLILMLQNQLKTMEELYKNALERQRDSRLHYKTISQRMCNLNVPRSKLFQNKDDDRKPFSFVDGSRSTGQRLHFRSNLKEIRSTSDERSSSTQTTRSTCSLGEIRFFTSVCSKVDGEMSTQESTTIEDTAQNDSAINELFDQNDKVFGVYKCDFDQFLANYNETKKQLDGKVDVNRKLMSDFDEQKITEKESVTQGQQTNRNLENKLEIMYRDLVKLIIKNKQKTCCDCEGNCVLRTDYKNAQEEILRLEEALRNASVKYQEVSKAQRGEVKRKEKIIDKLQNELSVLSVELKNTKRGRDASLPDDLNGEYRDAQMCLKQSTEFLNEELKKLMKLAKPSRDEEKNQFAVMIREEERVDELHHKLKRMVSDLENTNGEITKCVNQNKLLFEEYRARLKRAQIDSELARNEIRLLKKKMKESHGKHVKQSCESPELENAETISNTELDRLKQVEEELLTANQNNVELTRKISNLERDRGQSKNIADEKIRRLEEETKSQGRIILRQEEQLKIAKRQKLKLAKEIKKIESELEARTKQNENRISQLMRELEVTIEEREMYVGSSAKLFSKFEKEIRRLNEDYEGARGEIGRLKTVADQVRNQNDELNGQIKEARRRIIRLWSDLQNGKLSEEELLEASEPSEIAKKESDVRNNVLTELRDLQNQSRNSTGQLVELSEKRSDSSTPEIGHLRESNVLGRTVPGTLVDEIIESAIEEAKIDKDDSRHSEHNELIMKTISQVERDLENEDEEELEPVNGNRKPEHHSMSTIEEESVFDAYDYVNSSILEKTLMEDVENTKTDIENEQRLGDKSLNVATKYICRCDKKPGRRKHLLGYVDQNEYLQNRGEQKADGKDVLEDVQELAAYKQKKLDDLRTTLKRSIELQLNESREDLKNVTICKDAKECLAYEQAARERSDLESRIKILVATVLHKDESIKDIQKKLLETEAKFDSINRESSQHQNTTLATDHEIKFKKVIADYEDVKNELRLLNASKDATNRKLTLMSETLREYEELLDSERKENALVIERVEALQRKICALEDEIAENESKFAFQLARSKESLAVATRSYEKLKKEYDELVEGQEDVKLYKKENVGLIHEIEERDEEIASSKNEIRELERQLDDVMAEKEEQNARTARNLEELQVACVELEKQLVGTRLLQRPIIEDDDDDDYDEEPNNVISD